MRFNTPLSRPLSADANTTNFEGAAAFTLTPEFELYTAVVTTALHDSFYEKAGDRLARLRQLIGRCEPKFVAQLAVYAREQMFLRTVPLVLVVELARVYRGDNLVSRLVARVVQRADEITELLALYAQANGRSGERKALNRLSKQVQKGLAEAFTRFDAYQLAKYDREGQVRLRDALFLTHAKGRTPEQQATFDQLVRGELPTPYTWETRLSALGQQAFENEAAKAAAFRTAWEELIGSGQLGYMALLRNLRNILEASVSAEAIDRVCQVLADPKAVVRARQLPFRFLSAYRELQSPPTGLSGRVLAAFRQLTGTGSGYAGRVLDALEAAVQVSAGQLRGFGPETRVVLACDVSGSMQTAISPRSTVQRFDIGLVLAMLLQSRCQHVVTGIFGDRWQRVALPRQQILRNALELHRREGEVGYATNGHLVVQDLLDRREVADKVLVFTDCQLWNTAQAGNQPLGRVRAEYRRRVAPQARLYLFDLAGLGTTPVQVDHAQGVALIAGWSDRVFDVLEALENGRSAVELIGQITF